MSPLRSFPQRGMAGRPQRTLRAQREWVVSSFLKRFRADVSGATAIEYALIAGIISIAIIGGATTIGQRLFDIFTAVSDGFPET